MDADMIQYLAAFLIGAAVGLGELVSRYRDEPARAVVNPPAALYVVINGAASAFALYAMVTLGIRPVDADAQTQFLVVMGAGFGAMAVFRSALFNIRVGDDDIGVGPVAFLDIILGATDRGVDRLRAEDRAPIVVWIMDGLVFDEVAASLPSFAMGLLQNLPAERQSAIAEQVKKLRDSSDLQEQAKVLNLGLLLMNEVGEDVLEKASRGLRTQFGWKPLGPQPRRSGWFGVFRRSSPTPASVPPWPVATPPTTPPTAPPPAAPPPTPLSPAAPTPPMPAGEEGTPRAGKDVTPRAGKDVTPGAGKDVTPGAGKEGTPPEDGKP